MMNFGNYFFARNLPMKAKVIVVKISPALVIDWMVSKEKHFTLLTVLSWGDRFQYLSMQQLEFLQLDLYCNQQFDNRDFFNNPNQRAENKDATLLVQVLEQPLALDNSWFIKFTGFTDLLIQDEFLLNFETLKPRFG